MKSRFIILFVVIVLSAAWFFTARGCRDAGPLRYVRLDDESTRTLNTPYPGSDIDAIELLRDGVLVGTAQAVVEAHILDGAAGNSNAFKDTSHVLGVADFDPAKRVNYLALGGKHAYVVVRMSSALEPGDTLKVHEIGASSGGSAEPCTVSIARDKDGPFTAIGSGAGPFEVIVPERVD